MTPTALLQHLQSIGCTIRPDGVTLHVSPRHLITPDLSAQIREHKAALLVLLTTAPVVADEAPLPTQAEDEHGPWHYRSTVLGADFWVCTSEADVEALRAEGEVPYTQAEVWQLQALKVRDPETFGEKLKAIHALKATFDATVDAVTYEVQAAEEGDEEKGIDK